MVDPLSVLTVHPTLVSMPLIWILLPITLAPDDLATAPAVRVGGAAHDHLVVERDTPVVVAVSKVGERRWGYHQFPKLSPLPGGKQLLTFNATNRRSRFRIRQSLRSPTVNFCVCRFHKA